MATHRKAPLPYDHLAVERKWQRRWEADGLHRTPDDDPRPKWYALTMFPYPSGDLHIGHWFMYTAPDAYARHMRMRGYNVLFPMGFDSFGLPAENAAIRNQTPPGGVDVREHRADAPPVPLDGDSDRLGAGDRHLRPVLLPLEPVAVPQVVRGGTGLPRRGARQLVPPAVRRCWPTSRC